jgi:hypothetical protein
MYNRVIPRDLFNESKLLKCLGQLALLLHNGVPWPLRIEYEDDGFVIDQNPATGGFYCRTLTLYCNIKPIWLESSLNSKDAYPLEFDEATLGRVFDDDGQFSAEFKEFLDNLQTERRSTCSTPTS